MLHFYVVSPFRHLLKSRFFLPLVISILFVSLLTYLFYNYTNLHQRYTSANTLHQQDKSDFESRISDLNNQYQKLQIEYQEFQSLDQVKINKDLKNTISQINKTFTDSLSLYEDLLDLKTQKVNTTKLDSKYASVLSFLSKQNYASASAVLTDLKKDVSALQTTSASVIIPANVPQKNSPPDSGYARQSVKLDSGTDYMVSIISADLSNTKVIVDTASNSDCKNDCPVNSLGNYASRSGAFAAINGPYFCPASYPSCADKKNSFDTLLMNKNKTYFNSDNNVYSSVPAAIFSSSSRFVSKSSEWGRDTGVDSVIANQPLLVFNGQSTFSGDSDPKKSSKGVRAFIGATDNKVYIGLVHNATVAEASQVLAKMGIRNALNLDSGGSTALWSNGKYLAGPGRDTPFGILLVRR